MSTVASFQPQAKASVFKDIVLPREHGSWSLAFEPIALGLLVAPSAAGTLLAVALSAGFFARRPFRIHVNERRAERRVQAGCALTACVGTGLLALAGAVLVGGAAWLPWLVPAAIAGAIFAHFDRNGAGREEAAEIAGSAAFAMVPAAIGILGGLAPVQAFALALLSLGRSVPSVLCVRAYLRAKKTGVHRNAPALITCGAAIAVTAVLYDASLASMLALAFVAALGVRAFALLVFLQPAWRARTIGMIESVLGVLFILGVGLTLNY
jgi:hypothetical protein